MLSGNFWIYPDGRAERIEGVEHAELALRHLLKLPPGTPIPRNKLYSGITMKEADAARARQVHEDVLDYLQRDSIDPRTWVVQKEGWIRVTKNQFNLWDWKTKVAQLVNSDYWDQQPHLAPHDMLDIDDLADRSGNLFSISVGKLRQQPVEHDEFEEKAEQREAYLPRVGGYTDRAEEDHWQYQRVGENPAKGAATMHGAPQTIFSPFKVRTNSGQYVEFVPYGENPEPPKQGRLGSPRRLKPTQRWGATWGSQIFVGLNVADQEAWTAEEIRDEVLRFRTEQLTVWAQNKNLSALDIDKIEHGASVRPQFGYWGKLGAETAEKSVGVLIECLSGESAELNDKGEVVGEFVDHMDELIRHLAVRFEQDAVLAQIHKHGTVLDTLAATTETF